jgi:hypothetical protein
MNKEAMLAWAEELEAGHPQIPYPMRDERGFCLLGLLCEAYRKKNGGEWAPAKCWCPFLADRFEPKMEFAPTKDVGSAHMPPEAVLRWLSLKCHCPREMREKDEHMITCEPSMMLAMEGCRPTFAEAAKIIRAWSGH